MKVIGLDPGIKGGIAVIRGDGEVEVVAKMPDTVQDIYELLREIAELSRQEGIRVVCYMESVGYGRSGQSLKATATFARHCGHLDMALLALGIPTFTVTPQKWEKHYQLGSSSGYSKTQWKNRLKAKAQQMFPNQKVTLAVADALLIAEYGRKQEVR